MRKRTQHLKCCPPTGGMNGMEYVFFLKPTCPGSQTGWKDDLPFPKVGKGSLGILDGNPDPLGTSGVLPSTVWMDLAICLRGMTGTSGVSQHVVPLSFKSCAS